MHELAHVLLMSSFPNIYMYRLFPSRGETILSLCHRLFSSLHACPFHGYIWTPYNVIKARNTPCNANTIYICLVSRESSLQFLTYVQFSQPVAQGVGCPGLLSNCDFYPCKQNQLIPPSKFSSVFKACIYGSVSQGSVWRTFDIRSWKIIRSFDSSGHSVGGTTTPSNVSSPDGKPASASTPNVSISSYWNGGKSNAI